MTDNFRKFPILVSHHEIMLNCYLILLATAVALVGAGRPVYRSDSVVTKSSYTSGRTGLGIYGGTNATIEEHPYLVSIVYEDALYCVGVILSDSWILTLPSCVAYMSPSDLTVVAESSDGVTGVSYAVKNWHTHPKYGGAYMDYMFTLIQISGTFTWSNKTQAAKLPSKDAKANTQMEVAGWGSTTEGSSFGEFQQGNMTWQTKKTCERLFASATSRTGCLYNEGKTTLCYGDFGVPAINNGVVYGQFLLGYTSGFCSADAFPVLFSDVASVKTWIKKYTGAKYDYE